MCATKQPRPKFTRAPAMARVSHPSLRWKRSVPPKPLAQSVIKAITSSTFHTTGQQYLSSFSKESYLALVRIHNLTAHVAKHVTPKQVLLYKKHDRTTVCFANKSRGNAAVSSHSKCPFCSSFSANPVEYGPIKICQSCYTARTTQTTGSQVCVRAAINAHKDSHSFLRVLELVARTTKFALMSLMHPANIKATDIFMQPLGAIRYTKQTATVSCFDYWVSVFPRHPLKAFRLAQFMKSTTQKKKKIPAAMAAITNQLTSHGRAVLPVDARLSTNAMFAQMHDVLHHPYMVHSGTSLARFISSIAMLRVFSALLSGVCSVAVVLHPPHMLPQPVPTTAHSLTQDFLCHTTATTVHITDARLITWEYMKMLVDRGATHIVLYDSLALAVDTASAASPTTAWSKGHVFWELATEPWFSRSNCALSPAPIVSVDSTHMYFEQYPVEHHSDVRKHAARALALPAYKSCIPAVGVSALAQKYDSHLAYLANNVQVA